MLQYCKTQMIKRMASVLLIRVLQPTLTRKYNSVHDIPRCLSQSSSRREYMNTDTSKSWQICIKSNKTSWSNRMILVCYTDYGFILITAHASSELFDFLKVWQRR